MNTSARRLTLVIFMVTLVSGIAAGSLGFRVFSDNQQRQDVNLDINYANALIGRVSTAIGMVVPSAQVGAPRALSGSINALQEVNDIALRHNWNELVKSIGDSIQIVEKYLSTFSGQANQEYALFLHQQSLLQSNLLIEQLSIISNQYHQLSIERSQTRLQILGGLILWIIVFVSSAALLFYRRIIKPITRAETSLIKRDYQSLETLGNQSAFELKKLFHALKRSHDKLEYQASHDFLTGLSNRYHLTQSIDQQLKGGTQAVAMVLDMDNFKDINDSLGHESGDILLQQIALRFSQSIEAEHTFARLGGDEFFIFVGGLADGQAQRKALEIANSIKQACITAFEIPNRRINISTSIGIALAPQHGSSYIELLRNADAAMYKSKSEGKSTCSFYDAKLTELAAEKMQIESDIKQALRDHQFYLDYQVQWNTLTQEPVGVEALIRWQHPKKGLIRPDTFIPIAESSWLIEGINDWVLTQSIKQLSNWQTQGVHCPVMSINLSAMRFRNSSLIDQIQTLTQRYHVSPSSICLEITEHTFLDSDPQVFENLNALRQIGVRISIDDFGTGYSSLSKLRMLPVDEIKIDRSFVDGIESRADALHVFESMLRLCQSLNYEVVAEGVELDSQLAILKSLNCNAVQGYLLARPQSPELVQKNFLHSQLSANTQQK